ncbi:hypothetical protein [Streptomyces sp. NBC_00102]|uniref:hypothetical protein n=1 Tax=Streptomyces sp. NBC_00102 TaxID=2975652 RepID=UPI002251B432|nr:hypothetical protein [Streptomyces sp. NBC_00102]MCX5395649.1 hypothetical protein [Streptomyces sp. NBC_00102]
MDVLNAQQLYHDSAIRTVYARVRQLARLATDAADHLLDAVDIVDATRAGVPARGGGPPLTYKQALGEAGRRLAVVQDLTALGALDAVAAAELFVTDRRRWVAFPHQPLALSPVQDAALRAVAQGQVTMFDNKPHVRDDDLRFSLTTIRSLESRGLVKREPCQLLFRDERVHPTADGCRTLAATFGRPRTPARTVARPSTVPSVKAARVAVR